MENKKPIIHGYFLCYNEEYILPHLLRYYLTFCEKIFILDNQSTDKSHEIIKSFPNTEIIPYYSNNQVRDDIYLDLKNNMWKQSVGEADYVIVGDADEFLFHENMIEFLTNSFKEGITIFKPEGYHMIGDEDLVLTSDDNIFEKVTEGIIGSSNDKLMLFDCNKIIEINYSFGCHIANPVGNIKYSNDKDLKMLHYKYLGLKDFIPKQKLRGERLSSFNKERGLGSYYLYDAKKHIDEYKTFIEKRKKVI
jgi:hypothetical protein